MKRFFENRCMKVLAIWLAVMTFTLSITPTTEAEFIASEAGVSNLVRQEDMARIRNAIEHKVVAKRLEAMGYNKEEIADKLDNLSDPELHRLAKNVDQLLPGGDGLGLAIGVLLVVFLVIVILKIANKRIVIS